MINQYIKLSLSTILFSAFLHAMEGEKIVGFPQLPPNAALKEEKQAALQTFFQDFFTINTMSEKGVLTEKEKLFFHIGWPLMHNEESNSLAQFSKSCLEAIPLAVTGSEDSDSVEKVAHLFLYEQPIVRLSTGSTTVQRSHGVWATGATLFILGFCLRRLAPIFKECYKSFHTNFKDNIESCFLDAQEIMEYVDSVTSHFTQQENDFCKTLFKVGGISSSVSLESFLSENREAFYIAIKELVRVVNEDKLKEMPDVLPSLPPVAQSSSWCLLQ